MLNAMAVRAEDNGVRERMKAPLSLRDAMVNIAPSLGPAATLALIPVKSYRSVRPRLPRFVAAFAGADGVGFPIVPHAVTLSLLRVGVRAKATAGLGSCCPRQVVALYDLVVAAVAAAAPQCPALGIPAHTLNRDKPPVPAPRDVADKASEAIGPMR